MKTNRIKKYILAALLLSTTLVISGCNHTAPAPIAATKAQLKHSFGAEHIAAAITNAAQDSGWQVKENGSKESLVLKKSFTKKETAKNTRGRIWNKANVSKEVVADVNVADKSYEINLTEDSKAFFSNYNSQKQLEKEMHKLQNAISVELVQEIL